jgi:hypothetical protein
MPATSISIRNANAASSGHFGRDGESVLAASTGDVTSSRIIGCVLMGLPLVRMEGQFPGPTKGSDPEKQTIEGREHNVEAEPGRR